MTAHTRLMQIEDAAGGSQSPKSTASTGIRARRAHRKANIETRLGENPGFRGRLAL